jgi:hypothetical protein
MSRSLRSYAPTEREWVAHRREAGGTMGLGYWGARDALAKLIIEFARANRSGVVESDLPGTALSFRPKGVYT